MKNPVLGALKLGAWGREKENLTWVNGIFLETKGMVKVTLNPFQKVYVMCTQRDSLSSKSKIKHEGEPFGISISIFVRERKSP